MNSHASLLLSQAGPTIISSSPSPLQSNTNATQNNSNNITKNNINNNPRASPNATSTQASNSDLQTPSRRISSTPLLTAPNLLDNNDQSSSQINIRTDNPLVISLDDININFKKPQNEIFKQLDGKIQKIVAAHSSLNKLYALNDFSSLSAKRPFELPPQLPPPPPWVPKTGAGQSKVKGWSEEAIERLINPNMNQATTNPPLVERKPRRAHIQRDPWHERMREMAKAHLGKVRIKQNMLAASGNASGKASIGLDSAISKLHQRRQQQHPYKSQPGAHSDLPSRPGQMIKAPAHLIRASNPSLIRPQQQPGQPRNLVPVSPAQISPAQLSLLTQRIKETLEGESRFNKTAERVQKPTSVSAEEISKWRQQINASASPNEVPETREKQILDKLVKCIQQEISAATRDMKFNSPVRKPPTNRDQIPLDSRTSAQALYNTIRRETSLLLGKQGHQQGTNQQASLLRNPQNQNRSPVSRSLIIKSHTVKVVVPPTEYHQPTGSEQKDSSENVDERATSRKQSKETNELTYQFIKTKLKMFQEVNRVCLGSAKNFKLDLKDLRDMMRLKKQTPKTLDSIVDRLQAKRSSSPADSDSLLANQNASFKQKIIQSSAKLLQSSQQSPQLSAPTPIPIFRTNSLSPNKGGQLRSVNLKSKRSKKSHTFGLKFNNYLEKDNSQLSTDSMTIEQYARGLGLFRPNDVSLRRRQEQLSQSESRWKMPVSNRPLRLRRLRAEGMPLMPASASYKATRRVGLQ